MTGKDLDKLVLESKHGELQVLIKGPMETSWRDGFPKNEPKLIVLQFDRYLCEVKDELDRQELTDEDREYVARAIDRNLADPLFTDYIVHEPPKITPPWPTYEQMHGNAIPAFAQQAGMIDEALLYETRRADGPREGVLRKLQELAEPQENASPVEEDDFAAV